jgi:uncharacterized protein YkwD
VKALRVLTALASLLVAGLSPLPVGAQSAPAPGPDPDVARVVALTNGERQKASLAPLTVNTNLNVAAQRYADAMATGSCVAHTCPPVPELPKRVELAGYSGWGRLAENIAAGQRSADEVVVAWMGSQGHRDNILQPDVTEIGIGHAAGGSYGVYWVQVFGTPRSKVAPPPPAMPPDAAAARLVERINAARQAAGLPPLRTNPSLTQVAQQSVRLMAAGECFGAECGAQDPLSQRAEAAGYTAWTALAEAAAAGQPAPEDVAGVWLSAGGSALLDARFTELGVGVAYGGRYGAYWAQALGSSGAGAGVPADGAPQLGG